MKIVCLVPIKLNSQRLQNKMMLPLGEKKLCQHIFDTLLEVKKEIDLDIYCYCSDENIKKYLPENVKFLKRDKNLDKDETKGIEIYKSFINQINGDIYMLCHATSPFIKSKSILKGLEKILDNNHDSALSVSKIQTFCWYKNKTLNYELTNVVRTQEIEPVFYETSAFYIFKKEILDVHNRRIGFNPFLVETDRIESIDIDEKEDYNLAKNLINI
jgi:CMP-N-acetylneuraminic acid synthetase